MRTMMRGETVGRAEVQLAADCWWEFLPNHQAAPQVSLWVLPGLWHGKEDSLRLLREVAYSGPPGGKNCAASFVSFFFHSFIRRIISSFIHRLPALPVDWDMSRVWRQQRQSNGMQSSDKEWVWLVVAYVTVLAGKQNNCKWVPFCHICWTARIY